MTLFKHSRLDGVLFLSAALQLPLFLAWCLMFDAWPWWLHASLLAPASLYFYFNPIVTTHNFLHTPFFAWRPLNSLFSVFNSANLLLPQALYKHHHLLHHRYNNDQVARGTTRDPSSTWRYGREGRQESVLPYCALGLFRDGTTHAYREIVKKGELRLFAGQTLAVVAALTLFCWLNWRWTLLVLVPVFYLGWFLAHLENYYEHFRASEPGERFGNSVSYYGPLYNIFMFNEGYHQAHHIEPGKHWLRRPEVQLKNAEAMSAARAVEAAYPPLLGFLDGSSKATDSRSPGTDASASPGADATAPEGGA